ncbi:MAG: starch-binding protein [Ruminococcus sp.]|nr:starch-binding protein [Ruminococcus sp.]
MKKRAASLVLAFCMVFTCLAAAGVSVSAANTDISEVSAQSDLASSGADYGLAKKVEDGNILHCFNWTLNQIKQELPNIASAGFTSVQTSPLQPHTASGAWYWLYQPTDSTVGNEIGSYSDLQSLCSEADKYGIKVIVDVVANHLAGWNDGSWNDGIAGSWRNSEYFHNEGACNDWDNRYDVTHKNIGMPDLNSEHSEVQNKFVSMVNGLKSAGVDGVRWDAAKHIGLPSEGCEFWSKIKNVGMFNYGEILDNPAGNSGDDYNGNLMREYANYIGVTDSSFSGHITGCIRDNKTDTWNGKWTNLGVPANRVVYWAESHDTYCNNGWTNSLNESVIDRAYAVVAARANSQSLYLSRPYEHNHDSIHAGVKGSTHFTSKQIAAVNHFHNAMVGTGEYFGADNGCFVVCRGGGAVIVSPNGSNFDITVANGGGMVPSGTYTDEVSGSTWTVSGSSISGHIGSSGIAVIYHQPEAGPSAFANPGNTSYKTDTITVTLGYSNATSGSYSIDGGSFKSYTNGQTITIGSGVSYGSKTTLVVKATKGSSTDQATYTYTKLDPNATQTIYFDNKYYHWERVYCYLYAENNGNVISNGEWPGVLMTQAMNSLYYYDVPKGLENGRAIFTEYSDNNDHRYPGDGDPGLDLNNNSMIFGDNRSWTVYTGGSVTPQPTSPPVTPTEPVTPTGKVLIGDTDLDNTVTVLDATAIQKYLVQLRYLSSRAKIAADADKDGVVSIIDATKIQKYLASIQDSNSYVGQYSDGSSPSTDPTTPTQQPTSPPVSGDSVVLNASATSEEPEAWYAWTWTGDQSGKWIKGEGSASGVVFTGLESKVIFVRANPEMEIDWNNGSVWNQTDDLDTHTGGTFTTTGWAANRMIGSWD